MASLGSTMAGSTMTQKRGIRDVYGSQHNNSGDLFGGAGSLRDPGTAAAYGLAGRFAGCALPIAGVWLVAKSLAVVLQQSSSPALAPSIG